jgi:hypothetical protein
MGSARGSLLVPNCAGIADRRPGIYNLQPYERFLFEDNVNGFTVLEAEQAQMRQQVPKAQFVRRSTEIAIS